jgi:AcrR family transcriptional regulator
VTTVTQRPMRADARRNREKVLAAAEALFADNGVKVQIEQVASRAGVGVGTVCRHFPTKEVLVEAVLTGIWQSLLDDAQAALADPDPASGFRHFVVTLADFQSRHRVLAEQMAANIELPISAVRLNDAITEAITELVTRAQQAGAIRSDIGPADMALLFAGIAHAAALAGDIDRTLRQRYLAIVLDGLRPLDPTPLPGRPLGFGDLNRRNRSPRT